MKNVCPDPTEFDFILTLDKTDPQRQHLEDCPRCRNLLKSMKDFNVPVKLSKEDEELCLAADKNMTSFLREQLDLSHEDTNVVAIAKNKRWAGNGLPLAAAAVLVLAFGIWQIVPVQEGTPYFPENPPSEVPMRGTHAELPQDFVLPAAKIQNNGVLSLNWAKLDNADAYDVILWSESLRIIDTVSAGQENFIKISDPLASYSTKVAYFCVVALKQQAEVYRSEMVALP